MCEPVVGPLQSIINPQVRKQRQRQQQQEQSQQRLLRALRPTYSSAPCSSTTGQPRPPFMRPPIRLYFYKSLRRE